MSGRVVGLFVYESKGAVPKLVDLVEADPRGGLVDDWHGGRPERDVLVVDISSLEDMDLKPSSLREQVSLEGFDLNSVEVGARLVIGNALLEVTKPCAPCLTIGGYNKQEDVELFRDRLEGRRGVFVRFVDQNLDQKISLGDAVDYA